MIQLAVSGEHFYGVVTSADLNVENHNKWIRLVKDKPAVLSWHEDC